MGSANGRFIYPCLCLCFLILHITRMTPFLRITLHLSHIFFTDDRTFMIVLIASDYMFYSLLSSSFIPLRSSIYFFASSGDLCLNVILPFVRS